MKSIGLIKWPTENKEAINIYINFQISVLEGLDIKFSNYNNDPIKIAKEYVKAKITEEEYNDHVEYWWGIIDSNNGIRDFQNKDMLIARLAICLLSVKKSEVDRLGDHLSWFFEVLQFLGFRLDFPLELMENHFKW